ncbi:NADase-type glycan-binding domain-containing protein [Luteolibacter luteus]|uniref:NAD glycohydrolase translocation F5/8 type C domain-containing protein n=1 Tax=Luteolibacter luteus TaxID=2728835 RepID=A0A858RHW4_9BACT|nr:hypothetical protein [Luteolibacter luteus]QJE96305.1 hypothetical protein HHL09_11080 [Luteolibacter luteus]
MKRMLFACLGFSAIAPQALLANGGGYFRGGIQRSGDIELFEPEEVEKIRMLDEQLAIDLGDKEAGVEIRYILKNETESKVKIRFGFPVEELFDNDIMNEGGDADPETSKKSDGKLKYCKDYEITAGGKKIEAKWKGEEKAGDDERFKGIAGWLVSELSFEPGEEKALRIAFRSSYPEEEWSVSDDSFTGPAIFKYRLSTAACWAGTIGTGRIVLRPAGIPAGELKVLKPANRFKKEGDNWVWSFENLEPAMADDIEIEARPEVKSYGRSENGKYDGEAAMVTYTERAGKWTMSHSNYQVTASSTLPANGDLRYDADQVKGIWDEGAWSEGAAGPGIGEWLEFKPQVPKMMTAINIYPGYGKDDALFKANARPRKVLITLNGKEKFTAEIPDLNEGCRIPVSFSEPVKTLRMTFQEVWKGSKHEDLCVSGVAFEVRVDTPPKISPAR